MPQRPGRQQEAFSLVIRRARRAPAFAGRLAFTFAATLIPATAPAPVQASGTQADALIGFAKNQLGKPYQYSAIGLRRYDCSGLVYRTFAEKNLLTKIGGGRKTAYGYYKWFKERGLASKYNGRRGDLVVWGSGAHIYLGSGMAISAFNQWPCPTTAFTR